MTPSEQSYSSMCECCERERPAESEDWVIGHDGEDLCPECVASLRAVTEQKIADLPDRIALCPDCAPEFYYPLAEGEGLTCPVCPLEMVVYTKASTSK